jgi:16S rRNA C967 or C1407 C5-methylase (RsmB/RsmF family)/NOL1/NOP2/fmu family ribosome biogenesis protein
LSFLLPEKLIRSLENLEHFDPDGFRSAHESVESLVTIHMNPEKSLYKEGRWSENILYPPFEISGSVPWAPDAYYLSSRPSFTLDPFFHAGSYYVQEASGMFLAEALKAAVDLSQNLKVLDLCAAPGGKSTLIQSLISPGSLLVSNEVIKSRIPALNLNMTKWGNINGIVSNNDPAVFKRLPGFFDILFVDAPCSGSGLFRKDPDAALLWSLDLVKLCSLRQERILADAWMSLKDDGILIYSTCSYSKEENEDILDSVFRQFSGISMPIPMNPSWNIMETRSDQAGAYGYRFYPDKVQGEGFFLAVIQKKEVVLPDQTKKINRNQLRIPKSAEEQLNVWIDSRYLNFIQVGDSVHLLTPDIVPDFDKLKNILYLKKAGIRVGKAGEREWIPDHELALANKLKPGLATLELNLDDSLRFLRGEPFVSEKGGKGWKLVSFQGQRLGWVKLLGDRLNNYYPRSWRIRQ